MKVTREFVDMLFQTNNIGLMLDRVFTRVQYTAFKDGLRRELQKVLNDLPEPDIAIWEQFVGRLPTGQESYEEVLFRNPWTRQG